MSKEDELELLSPPGDTILEHLKYEFAESIGLTHEYVDGLLKGDVSITPETAVLLEKRFSIDREFWLRREEIYRQKLLALTDHHPFG